MTKTKHFSQLAGEKHTADGSSARPISLISNAASQSENRSLSSCSSKLRNNNAVDSVISGMVPALAFGQCFSLLPVSNAACKGGQSPHFSWLSLRMLYSVIMTFFIFSTLVLTISFYIQNGIATVFAFQTVIFYLSNALWSCLFIRLAGRWASLCTEFQEVENRIRFYRYGDCSGFNWHMKTATAVLMTLGLGEHAISQVNSLVRIKNSSNGSEIDWLQSYYDDYLVFVKFHLPFSPLLVIVGAAINVTAAFIWNYSDLFIVLISMAIASKYQHLNVVLLATFHEVKGDRHWKHLRETYNAVRTLTENVECSLSYHVLLSFVNNVFFICVELLHSLRFNTNTLNESFYFFLSFGVLVLRTVFVGLSAASIHEKSRAIKQVLFSVPSENYCVEVGRFLNQVTSDYIALTGCNYFSVTRSFLLAVFGTVVTYEIVLVQLHGLQQLPKN